MGQFYNILFGDETGNHKALYETTVHYPNNEKKVLGYKLMEHSYIDNELMKAIGAKLLDSPHRIIWAGDYSNENNEADYEIIKNNLMMNPNIICPTYEDAWPENRNWSKPLPSLKAASTFTFKGLYLLNHDQKQYINLNKYMKTNTTKCAKWLICICPIPLLTAIGNGRGGGDYYGEDMQKVGTWAWNLISLSTKNPQNYEELKVKFKEYA